MARHPERTRRPRRFIPIPVAALAVATILVAAGCTPAEPRATPERTPSSGGAAESPAPGSTPTPDAPPAEVVVDGTAAENLPVFTAVTAAVWASPDRAAGRAYIDALVAAGFDKAAMQVTNDTSTIGNPAESIQFSVRWGEECLIGQVGPATGDPVTTVVPVLAEGTCLIGQTRPITW
ncbi:MAG: hypothetical protein WBX17_11525 [Microbacterium sp.]